jgi:hypothetical protein
MRESWDTNEFGVFLSNLRNSSGLSLEELAGLVASSRSTLSRLGNNEVPRPFSGLSWRSFYIVITGSSKKAACSRTRRADYKRC